MKDEHSMNELQHDYDPWSLSSSSSFGTLSSSSSSFGTIEWQQRLLTIGDFDNFNKLFRNAEIALPDTSTSQNYIDVSLTNLKCYNITIGDIITSWSISHNGSDGTTTTDTSIYTETLQYEINIVPFSVDCSADYSFQAGVFGLIRGHGTLAATSTDSSVGLRIDVSSLYGFTNDFPTSATLGYCLAALNIDSIHFNGPGIVDNILNVLDGLVRNIVQDKAKEEICNKLATSMPSAFDKLLNRTKSRIDDWMKPVSDDVANPLYIEQYNFTKPKDVNILQFMKNNNDTSSFSFFAGNDDSMNGGSSSSSSTIGNLLIMAMQQAGSFLGSYVDDPNSTTTGTNGTDLSINVMIRQSLLNDNRILDVNLTDGSDNFLLNMTTFNPVVYENDGGMLTQSKIVITSIRITGLDTITVVDPFRIIGNYTIQNIFSWDNLFFELDLMITMKPSTSNTSILVNPDPNYEIVEHITIAMNFTKIDLNVSIFLAIDIDQLEQIQLGSLLYSENLLPCLVQTIYDLQVSGLIAHVQDISTPSITGFVTPGLDRLIGSITDAGLAAFEPTIIKAMPNIFQGPIRKILSKQFLDGFFSPTSSSSTTTTMKCPTTHEQLLQLSPPYIDYRDMLLTSSESKGLGGTGNDKMYGNMIWRLYGIIQSFLNKIDEATGQPWIDEKLITPFTKRQSDQDGVFRISRDIFSLGNDTRTDSNQSVKVTKARTIRILSSTFSDSLASSSSSSIFGSNLFLKLSNLRIYNLDTVSLPLQLLHPTKDANTLTNEMNIGINAPLNITTLLSFGSSDFINDIDISVSFDTMNVLFNILALIQTDAFATFPLGDVFNVDCWFATMPSIQLDENGIATTSARSITIPSFHTSMTTFGFDATCVDCQSYGIKNSIPSLLLILNETNATSTLGSRILPLLDAIMTSNTIQTFFDRRVNEAPMFCPSTNPNYNSSMERRQYNQFVMPALNATSIDTLLYAMTLLVDVGIVIFSESLLEKQGALVPVDPLSIQKSFVIPDGMRIIDWTDLSGSTGFGTIIDELFNQTRLSLSGQSSSSFSIKSLLEYYLEGGILNLPLNVGMTQDDLSLKIKSIRIFGLNDFVLRNLLLPLGPQTLSFSAQFTKLRVEIDVVAESSMTSNPQKLVVDFSMKNLNINLALFAAFDLDRIANLTLGSLLNTSLLLRCFLSTAYRFEIPEMNVTLDSLTTPKVIGLMADTSHAVSSATEKVFTQYKQELVDAIPILFGGVIKDSLSNLVGSYYEDSHCPNAAEALSEDSFVDYRDLFLSEDQSKLLGGSGLSPYGNLFRSVYKLLTDEFLAVDPKTNLAAINQKLIAKFTQSRTGMAGEWRFPNDLLNHDERVQAGGLDAFVKLRIYDSYLKNLDTVGAPLGILQPVNGAATILNNSAAMGIGRSLIIGSSLLISLANDGTNITNDLDFSVELEKLYMLASAFVKLSEKAFFNFPIKDISKLSCWLAAIPAPKLDEYTGLRLPNTNTSLGIEKFAGSAEKVGFNITCKQCTGSLGELSELLSEEKNSAAVTNVTNSILILLTNIMKGEYLTVAIDRALNDAPYQCPHSPLYEQNFVKPIYAPFETNTGTSSVSFLIAILIVSATALVVAVGIKLVTKTIVRRRHQKWLARLRPDQLHVLYAIQNEKKEKESELNVSTTSMFCSESIPPWVRIFVPIVILGNIAFFLSGHLSLGASVSILVTLGGETLRSDNFFSFSMARSTIEIWNAGGQALALIIFFASFAWPYTKQVITMGLWFASPNTISVSTRGTVLLWLDALAKWSIIDIFVLVVTIVSLRVSIKSPDVPYLPAGLYEIDLLVIPKWGLYANMIAQLICQISSHFIIHYHRRIIQDASNRHLRRQTEFELDDQEDHCTKDLASQKLCNHAFRRAHRGESDKLVARRCVNPCLLAMGLLVAILIVIGCILPTFSVNILGIVGVLVESGQAFVDAKYNYSILTMIQALFEQASLTGGFRDYLGLFSLSFLVVLSVLVVPILQILALLVQWLVPLTRYQRNRLSVSIEILRAWQYVEVYLLAVLVGSWQLGTISEYMINPYCKSLQDLFGALVYYGILKEEDAQCLKTDIAVEPTFFILFAAALILAFMNAFVMRAERHFFSDADSTTTIPFHQKAANLQDLESIEDSLYEDGTDVRTVATSIKPAPVMFSDSFRWCLCREDVLRPSLTSLTNELALADTYKSQDSPISSDPRSGCNNVSFDESDAFTGADAALGGFASDGDFAVDPHRSNVLCLSSSHDLSEASDIHSNENVKKEQSFAGDALTLSSLNTSDSYDIQTVHNLSTSNVSHHTDFQK